MTLELRETRDGALAQLVAAADHVESLTVVAVPDRQRQAPVALLRDHPVAHVAQPVELAIETEIWDPANLARHVHHHVPQLVHADVPLVD